MGADGVLAPVSEHKQHSVWQPINTTDLKFLSDVHNEANYSCSKKDSLTDWLYST
jgi:hypothetical protein